MLGLLAASAPTCAQRYPILPVGGSPQDVKALFEDSKSRMWVGTGSGLYLFDGERFYSMRGEGFPQEEVTDIAEDGGGGIWATTNSGPKLGRTAHGGLYLLTSGHVQKLSERGADSVVKVGADVMLVTFQSESKDELNDLYSWRREGAIWKGKLLLAGTAGKLAVDTHGSALFPCAGGWCELQHQDVVSGAVTPGGIIRHTVELAGDNLGRVFRDRFGCVWARSFSRGYVGCVPGQTLSRLPPAVIGPDARQTLVEGPDGRVLSLNNFAYGRPGAFLQARPSQGIPGDMLTATVASDGTIWLGCESGLYRFAYPYRMEYWTAEEGVNATNTILRVGDGIYAGGARLSVLDKARRSWDPLPGTEDLGTIISLAAGPANTLYAAAYGREVTQVGATGRILARSPGASRGMAVAQDADGQWWLGGKGIFQITRRGRALDLSRVDVGELPTDSALDMSYDGAHKTLWACDWTNVVARHNGNWKKVLDSSHMDNFCESLAVDHNGDLWIAYGGMAEFLRVHNAYAAQPKSPQIQVFKTGPQVGDAYSAFLRTDTHGWLWRASDAEYVATPESAANGSWLRLDSLDGIPQPGANSNAFYADSDGSIWFGNRNTLVHFHPPDDFVTVFPTPKVFLAGYSVGAEQLLVANNGSEIPSGRPVVAHVGSLQFDRRSAFHLRWRLLPDQSVWQESRALDLALGRPRWGPHRLQLQAQMANGPWSDVEEQSFTVLRPVWMAWQTLLGIGVVFVTLSEAVRRWSQRRRAIAAKMLPELSHWRLAALSPELKRLQGMLLDGRYEVGVLVARGGFAMVLSGKDTQHGGRPVAIKIFRQELLDKAWMEKRFQQEVKALQRVQHPNVVRIYASGRVDTGAFYLVMEFIEGATLRERMNAERLPLPHIAAYVRETGSALQAIHAEKICHRDLKPENLMIRSKGLPGRELVLIDFSIAIVKDPDETIHGLSRAAGTLSYMAPEQAIGYADCSSDIYSLAKILVEMLAGERLSVLLPDAAMDLPERVMELLRGLNTPLSQASIRMIGEALRFDPARRPQDAALFTERIAHELSARTA